MVVDGEKLENIESFYHQLESEVSLPMEFGYNLDALWDFLCEYHQKLVIEVDHIQEIKEKWGFLGESLLEILGEISYENPEIKVIFRES